MTIAEKIVQFLVSKGMFESQAAEVLELMKRQDAETGQSMLHRWNDRAEGYPSQVFAVLFLSANRTALEWIDANMPRAWYRPMFAGN